MKINRYTTVVHAVEGLKQRGYITEFKLDKESNRMQSLKSKKFYRPADMEIVEYHRFEGISNPSDMSIVFAIETNDGNKGIVVSTYGMYAEMKMVEFMDKVKIKERSAGANG